MEKKLKTSLFVFIVLTIAFVQSQGCEHNGKTYKKGDGRWEECNSCTCTSDGGWACTELGCITGTCYHKGLPYKDGQVIYDECNTCNCNAKDKDNVGILMCTSKACRQDNVCYHNGKEHSLDSVRYQDCNSCTCGVNGWLCTNIDCPTGVCYYEGNVIKTGESYNDGCNDCLCSVSNETKVGVLGCTIKLCLPKSRCPEERDQWKTSPLGIAPPGTFVPKCKTDGSYEDLQCHGSIGECWCVDPVSGKEHLGSRTRRGESAPVCGKKVCVRPCQRDYKPVCGSNGITYPNKCSFENAQCEDSSITIQNYFACTDDGKSVAKPNPSKESEPKIACLIRCPKIYAPLCGSDGKTYDNKCYLEAQKDCGSPDLTVLHKGKCEECGVGQPIVSCTYDPCAKLFCKDDEKAICKSNYCGGCKAEFFVNGEKYDCKKTGCIRGCPFNYEPVCGSDGKTYSNKCTFEVAQCEDESKTLYLSKKGDCKETASKLVTVKGKILLPPTVPSVLPPDSCLVIKIIEEVLCDAVEGLPCNLPLISSKKLDNPAIRKDGTIQFSLSMENKPNTRFIVSTILNVGWCQTNGQTLRNGDFFTDVQETFDSPESGVTEVSKDISLKKFVEKPKPSRDNSNECGVDQPIVSCTYDPCAKLLCKDDEKAICKSNYCGGCKAEFFLNGEKYDCKKTKCIRGCPFNYEPVCGSDGKTYPNKCTFEVAQCEDESKTLYLSKEGDCKVNVIKATVSGEVILPKNTDSLLPGSCLNINIQEQILCTKKTMEREEEVDGESRGCKIPSLANIYVEDLLITPSGTIPYTLSFASPIKTRLTMHATINNGWCQKNSGENRIRKGDYINDFSVTFDAPPNGAEIKQDLQVIQYGKPKLASKELECPTGTPIVGCSFHPCLHLRCDSNPGAVCRPNFCGKCAAEWYVGGSKVTCAKTSCSKICTREYNPVCGSDGKTYSNRCLFEVGQCEDNTLSVAHGGECSKVAKCTAHRDRELAQSKNGPIVGNFVPVCDDDGNYKKLQCHGSTGYCFCVEPKTGEKIVGTEKRPGQGEVKCEDIKKTSSIVLTRCIEERDQWKKTPYGIAPPGAFVPECTNDGQYQDLQCHGSTGDCWCAEADTGKEKKGTRRSLRYGQKKPDCSPAEESITVSGNIQLPSKSSLSLLSSCLDVKVNEEILCDDPETCNVPTVASKQTKNPLVSPTGMISYSIDVKLTPKTKYTLNVALSSGGCKKPGDTSPRNIGDFINDLSYPFEVPSNGEKTLALNVELVEIKGSKEAEKENECPKDVPIVTCTYEPCKHLVCEGDRDAICKPNYCGGCNAEFFKNGKKIQCAKTKCLTACPLNYDPICGNDGKTYSNLCTLQVTQCEQERKTLARAYKGVCKEAEKENECPKDVPIVTCTYEPCKHLVCEGDRDAICKPNYCGGCNAEFFKNGKKIQCAKTKCLTACPLNYDPICGNDGKTYSNLCTLQVTQCEQERKTLARAYKGVCKEAEKENECPKDVPIVTCTYEPCKHLVCEGDRDAICKPNYCGGCNAEFFKNGKKIQCAKTKCLTACPLNYDPICGNDGKTYSNLCTLQVTQCEQERKTLARAYKGVCKDKAPKVLPYTEVFGYIYLPPNIPTKFPRGSCLSMSVIEAIFCDHHGGMPCVPPPVLAQYNTDNLEIKKVIRGFVLKYRMTMKVPKEGGRYIVQARISNGYCSDKNEPIRFGDYHTDTNHEFVAKRKFNRVDIDIVEYIDPSKQKDKCLRGCTFEYEPVCASDGRTIDNKCLFNIEKCRNNDLKIVSNGPCSECPPGLPIVRCVGNPCDVATCPLYPDAECKPNYCGACNAQFYKNGDKVDCSNEKSAAVVADPSARKAANKLKVKPCSMKCPFKFEPVCGSDRKTHVSQCHMELQACTTRTIIFKMHDGTCNDCAKACTREYNPQCGTDGKTYSNKCEMDKQICESNGRVGLAYGGPCDNPLCPQICTADYNPKCGTDGKTYGNMCNLQAKACSSRGDVKLAYDGECRKCSPICTREYAPHCGTDGKTYSNKCMMNFGVCKSGGRIQLKYKGKCGEPTCPLRCPQRRSFVCGTDDNTYASICSLQQKTCQTRGKVYLKHLGKCAKQCQQFNICPYIYAPVCGSDGKTYSNMCLMRGAICKSNGAIEFSYRGECKSECPSGVPIVRCAVNPCETAFCGKYLRATCQASFCGSCKAEFYFRGKKVEDCGTTCNGACTADYVPQCGSNGQTYGNPCTLNFAKCESGGKIQLAYPGECKKILIS